MGERRNPLGMSCGESKYEESCPVDYGDEEAMDNGSRTAHEDPPPARTLSREQ